MAMLERPHQVNLEIRGFAHQVLGASRPEPISLRKTKSAQKSRKQSQKMDQGINSKMSQGEA